MQNVEKEYKNIMTLLARKHPAFYIFAKHLEIVYVKEHLIETSNKEKIPAIAATNGRSLIITDLWLNQSLEQKFKTILHELWHNFLRHPVRLAKLVDEYSKEFQPRELIQLFGNLAFDIKVDYYYLKHLGYSTKDIPFDLSEEQINTLSGEEIFKLLLKYAKITNSAGDIILDKVDSAKQGKVLNKGSNKLKNAKNLEELDEALQKAARDSLLMAKTAGASLSCVEERILQELVKPKVNWNQVLRNELREWAGKNIITTFTKNHRKFPTVLPGHKRLGFPNLWVFIDVSGSISDQEFNQFLSEVFSIFQAGIREIRIITWDAKITGDYKIKNRHQIPKIRFKGGGGTEFCPVILQYIHQIKPTDLVIVLTDGVWFDREKAEEVLSKMSSRKILVTTHNEEIRNFDIIIKIGGVN